MITFGTPEQETPKVREDVLDMASGRAECGRCGRHLSLRYGSPNVAGNQATVTAMMSWLTGHKCLTPAEEEFNGE